MYLNDILQKQANMLLDMLPLQSPLLHWKESKKNTYDGREKKADRANKVVFLNA